MCALKLSVMQEKGQVTIPQEIRDRLGIRPGSEVDFRLNGRTASLSLARKTNPRARRLVEHLRGKGSVRLTTDEIMALTRGE